MRCGSLTLPNLRKERLVLNQAARFSHYIIAIKQGKIVSQGSAHDIMCADMLRDVFGVEAIFFEDPRTGKPVCIPFGTCLK